MIPTAAINCSPSVYSDWILQHPVWLFLRFAKTCGPIVPDSFSSRIQARFQLKDTSETSCRLQAVLGHGIDPRTKEIWLHVNLTLKWNFLGWISTCCVIENALVWRNAKRISPQNTVFSTTSRWSAIYSSQKRKFGSNPRDCVANSPRVLYRCFLWLVFGKLLHHTPHLKHQFKQK